jgi:cytochrome P450 RapN
MSYGLGEHNCVGIRLARMILRNAFGRWVERFPDTQLADPGFKPTYTGAVGELRMASLPLRIRAELAPTVA